MSFENSGLNESIVYDEIDHGFDIDKKILELWDKGMIVSDIARELSLKPRYVYRIVINNKKGDKK